MNYVNLYNSLEKDAGIGSIFSNAIKSVKNRIGGSILKPKSAIKTMEQPITNSTFKQKIIQPSELSKYTDIAKTRNYTKGTPKYPKPELYTGVDAEPIKKKMSLGKKIMIGAGATALVGGAGASWLNNKNNDETKMASNGGPDLISRMKNWRNLQKKTTSGVNLSEYNLLNNKIPNENLGKKFETKPVVNESAPAKKKWSTGKKIMIGVGGTALAGTAGISYLNRNNNANTTDNQLG